jgi:hypothetical protein
MDRSVTIVSTFNLIFGAVLSASDGSADTKTFIAMAVYNGP